MPTRRLLNFFDLPFSEKLLFCQAFFAVAGIRLTLWLVPFKILRKFFEGFLLKKTSAKANDICYEKAACRAVKIAARRVPGASCLTQALAMLLLMRANRQRAELKIGVKKDPKNGFLAHAWLESGEGRVLIGDSPERHKFKVMD